MSGEKQSGGDAASVLAEAQRQAVLAQQALPKAVAEKLDARIGSGEPFTDAEKAYLRQVLHDLIDFMPKLSAELS